MEGRWRAALVVLTAACLLATASGCGGDSHADDTVTTNNPARAFAPVVYLHPQEPFRPMSARWFLARSALMFTDGNKCDDRKIAVGRRLKEQRNYITNWLFVEGIGRGPNYHREPYADARCDQFGGASYDTGQLTRPYDDSPDRVADLPLRQGFFLDLMDWARRGPKPRDERGQAVIAGVPAWFEQRKEDVEGEPGLRITYWLLYGKNQVSDAAYNTIAEMSHEGDWERVQVLLQGSGDAWRPLSVRLASLDGRWRDAPWSALRREKTHPVLFASHGSHTLYRRPDDWQVYRFYPTTPGVVWTVFDTVPPACKRCPRWETAETLAPVRKQAWHGFGGAWGQVGGAELNTGPLGPHGDWDVGAPEGRLKPALR